jgi:hypothetical protein
MAGNLIDPKVYEAARKELEKTLQNGSASVADMAGAFTHAVGTVMTGIVAPFQHTLDKADGVRLYFLGLASGVILVGIARLLP